MRHLLLLVPVLRERQAAGREPVSLLCLDVLRAGAAHVHAEGEGKEEVRTRESIVSLNSHELKCGFWYSGTTSTVMTAMIVCALAAAEAASTARWPMSLITRVWTSKQSKSKGKMEQNGNLNI